MAEDKYNFRLKGVCALECDGKFLVIKRRVGNHGPLLIFPGGKVEIGCKDDAQDILENTVRREISEELGIHIDRDLHYLCSNLYVDNFARAIIDVTFHCCLGAMPAVVADPEEVPEYFWLSTDEIESSKLDFFIGWKIAKIQELKAKHR
ncbi:MAG: NUDIX hydrolase [Puniceicoccales bacterium]|jgi:8-oxo-dGTP pyrophosphatase MutT (NUDIX family)|nr:NUDIX hydrolase [Puniceicoccales bacterium]